MKFRQGDSISNEELDRLTSGKEDKYHVREQEAEFREELARLHYVAPDVKSPYQCGGCGSTSRCLCSQS